MVKEDDLDGCDIEFDEDTVSDDEIDMLVLFPSGPDEKLEAEYKELWS